MKFNHLDFSSAQRRSNLNKITFVTGFWQIANNVKHPLAHYQRTVWRTCRLIQGGRLVLFQAAPETIELFEAPARRHGVSLHPVSMPLENLPGWVWSAGLVRLAQATDVTSLESQGHIFNEKAVSHIRRNLEGTKANAYRCMQAINTSKIELIQGYVMPHNPFNTSWFAWVDASAGRFNRLRRGWDFLARAYDQPALYHYGSPMRVRGVELPLNGSILVAPRHVWQTLEPLFKKTVEKVLTDDEEPYPYDNEILLALIIAQRPDLFAKIGDQYPSDPMWRWLYRRESARAIEFFGRILRTDW